EMPRAWRSPEFTRAVAQGAEHLLNQFARDEYNVLGAFPPFEPRDAFLALRVLARLGLAPDARGARVIEKIWGKQNAGARWDVEKDLSAETFAHFDANALSKWATLAVLRIVTRLNFAQVSRGVESG
ncbi:MAG: hypothetical protein HY070_06955, partial [Chloroflexi bacterium]|nr:hypothetical protein [Chloroflexota bacterium]